jgi:hypothetical protein
MKQFSIQIEDKLAAKLEKQAKDEGRSRNKQIEQILKAYYAAKK